MAEVAIETQAQEIRALLGAFMRWAARQEAALGVMHNVLAFKVGLGVARCDEIDLYNREAVYLYSWQLQIVSKAKAAQITLPAPGFPLLFARNVGVDAEGNITAQFDCSPEGYVDRGSTVINAPPPCAPVGGQLGFPALAPSVGCVAAPWSCGVLLVLGAATYGAVLYIGLEAARRLVGAFTGAEVAALKTAVATKTLENDAKRLAAAQRCALERSSGVNPADVEAVRRIWDECTVAAAKSLPDRGIPDVSPPSSWPFWLGATLLTVAVGGVVYLVKRKAPEPRQRALPAPQMANAFGAPSNAKLHRIATEISDLGFDDVAQELVKPH